MGEIKEVLFLALGLAFLLFFVVDLHRSKNRRGKMSPAKLAVYLLCLLLGVAFFLTELRGFFKNFP